MVTRRTILVAPVAAVTTPAVAARRKMTLCIHQTTSLGAGYRKSLEGWAKAGIKNVELSAGLLEDFLKSDTLDGARKIISDLDLKVVSGAALAPELFTDRPGRAAALETFKRRCALFKALGADKVYTPSVPTGKVTAEDFKAAPGYIREFGEIARQHDLIAMLEFLRDSALIATMSTLMKLIRDANNAGYSGRRRHPSGSDSGETGTKKVYRIAIGRVVPAGVSARRSLRGGSPDSRESRSCNAPSGGYLEIGWYSSRACF